MSTHASTKIDQKEYLKKYLSGKKVKKKKKEKKHKSQDSSNVIIIDDDIGVHGNGPEIDEELLLTGDDAPQIVGEYSEEGPNTSSAAKWRSIAVKEEKLDEDELRAKLKTELEVDLWGRKDGKIKEEPGISPPPRSRRMKGEDDSSPRRRNEHRRRSKSTDFKRRDKSATRKDRAHKYSSDKSPQRKGKHSACKSIGESVVTDQSPVRKRRESPVRRRDKSKSRDHSPPRRRRKESSDQSPPRHRDSDQSPARKRLPSPGRQRRRKDSSDQSPPRNRSSDRNPPSRRAHSPPRRHRRSSDQSPPRKRFSSNSPTRIKREKLTPDQSPPRPQKMRRTQESPPRHSRWKKRVPTKSPSPPPTHKPKSTKTLDGKKAGLQDAQAMKAETEERRRQEDRMFAKMSSDVSGRDAEVAVRSTGRRGRRARDAAAEDPEEQRRKEAQEKKKRELYERWGKGLKQIEDHRLRLAEQEHESSKPLARYSNDEDLDRHLREQERLDDPMLEYMRKKKTEREKEANVPTIPVYQGSFPENRFGIRPGYRWDGVDRSNGYEKKWFDVQNERCAVREEAYKYSVEDM